ncbi:NUDIX hydrolase [Pseudomaricurvus sp. HS19]|uniref:NUDIX hydrolase n=1 Tax=Pseudomaricurvus sp. HS19 TaxID=2692626 RepID=UPI00136ED58C|nr:NUDIX hydrolase [Pseudomaricurvus sp. HS19]MYM64468.1 NUDIX domain-containing protein [Pseudomaricurvus sp. HS19]
MKYKTVATIVPLLALLSAAAAGADTPRKVNAGVLPYACTDQGARYLLAFDPALGRRAWAAFGGGPKGNETADATARREFYEETNCSFNLKEIALVGPSVAHGFYAFVARVPYIDTTTISTPRQCQDVERSRWIWVEHKVLLSALDSPQPKPTVTAIGQGATAYPLWSKSLRAMRQQLQDGLLSEQDPCLK